METSNVDGESNLKVKVVPELASVTVPRTWGARTGGAAMRLHHSDLGADDVERDQVCRPNEGDLV